jgi:hypothetical protein
MRLVGGALLISLLAGCSGSQTTSPGETGGADDYLPDTGHAGAAADFDTGQADSPVDRVFEAARTTSDAPLPHCAPGFTAYPDGCWASPPGGTTRPVIVFLHGVYDPDQFGAYEEAWETDLALTATGRGMSVLLARGREGLCSWDSTLLKCPCFPSIDGQVSSAPDILAGIQAALADLVGPNAPPPNLYGFGNGAYFAEMILSRNLMTFGAAVIHSGGPTGTTPFDPTRKIPLLLNSATNDAATIVQGMSAIDNYAAAAGWPVQWRVRPGYIAMQPDDTDAVLSFFADPSKPAPGVDAGP